jgi:cell division protein FtsB
MSRQLDDALAREQTLKDRNAKLASEVQDLREGTGAVEERARFELGLIKDNEIFIQVIEPGKSSAATAPNKAASAKGKPKSNLALNRAPNLAPNRHGIWWLRPEPSAAGRWVGVQRQ